MWSKVPHRYRKLFYLFIFCELVVLLPFMCFVLYFNQRYRIFEFDEEFYQILIKVHTGLISFCAAAYGFLRGLSFPMIFDQKYFPFLVLSPCNDEKRLIYGRVSLYWLDVVVLFFIMFSALLFPIVHVLFPLIAFLGVYLFAVYLGFLVSENRKFFIYPGLVLLLAPFLVFPFKSVEVAFIILLGFYVIALVGVRKFFRNFPWNTKYWTADHFKIWRKEAFSKKVVQWPYRDLFAEAKKPDSPLFYLALSGLLLWWIHVIIWFIQEDITRALPVYYFLVFIFALLRLVSYALYSSPPINFWGRIWTGHIIIPGYDKIFIAPLLILLVGFSGPLLLQIIGLPVVISYEIMISVTLFLTCSLPPSVRSWKYTGHHQMVYRHPHSSKKSRARTFNH